MIVLSRATTWSVGWAVRLGETLHMSSYSGLTLANFMLSRGAPLRPSERSDLSRASVRRSSEALSLQGKVGPPYGDQ